jgi:hypothetical protein
MAAAGYQPRRDLLSAAGKPLGGYSARLDGQFHLDMDNPPRPRQDGKIDKGIACHRQIRRSRENGTGDRRGLLVAGACGGVAADGSIWAGCRPETCGRAGGRRPYRASWEDRLRSRLDAVVPG